jgi:hypothetical protein
MSPTLPRASTPLRRPRLATTLPHQLRALARLCFSARGAHHSYPAWICGERMFVAAARMHLLPRADLCSPSTPPSARALVSAPLLSSTIDGSAGGTRATADFGLSVHICRAGLFWAGSAQNRLVGPSWAVGAAHGPARHDTIGSSSDGLGLARSSRSHTGPGMSGPNGHL